MLRSDSKSPKVFVDLIERFVGDVNNELSEQGKLVKTLNLKINANTGKVDLRFTEKNATHLKVDDQIESNNREAAKVQIITLIEDAVTVIKKYLKSYDFSNAKKKLGWVKALLKTNHIKNTHLDRMIYEIDFFLTIKIPPKKRAGLKIFREPARFAPQSLFFIEVDDKKYFGRKHISNDWLSGDIKDIHCAKINCSMIQGVAMREQFTEDELMIYYYPLNDRQKLQVFELASQDPKTELYFPYPYLTESKHEIQTQPQGWDLNPSIVNELDAGEKVFREITLEFLSKFNLSDRKIFDPACSTGTFLASIKSAHPECITIGQDLSAEMVDYARSRVDIIHQGDSINSPVKSSSVDFIFYRFLNSEVVTTNYAHKLFANLNAKLRPGGYAIIFGHTPVLINRLYFEKLGLSVQACSAFDKKENALLQYYILQKKNRLK